MSFTNLNEQFHIFSKSPVRAGQTLGSARNKSGHTVTTSDIWAEDIPALFYAYTTNQRNNFKNIASDNDLCYDKEINKLYYFKSGSWIERDPLYDGEILFNSNAAKNSIFNDGEEKSENEKIKGVVQYHKEKFIEAISSSNNNESAGNGYTGRIKKSDGTYISQFVSSMDKLVSGNPSSYYEPIILNGSNPMEESSEDTTEKKYIANSYAGIIQFHQDDFSINNGNFVGIKASVFEYIGKKLDSTLSNISEDLNSDKSDRGVRVVQTNGKIESVKVTPVTITNGSITNNGDNVISGNQVVTLINNAKTELLAAGVQYKVLSQSEQLPKASETYKGCIYLMPESNRISGSYLEYMCVQKEDNSWTWEQIGTTKTDLNGYITDEEFEEHSLDSNIHITNAERTFWNNNVTTTTTHINDDDIHVTDAEKSSWNENVTNSTNHINNDDIHVTDAERTFWNNNVTNSTNHINNDDIHVTLNDKNAWNTHKNDTTKHITSSERTSWNNKIDSITGDDFINCEKNNTNVSLSLNTTEEIIDSDVHVPTSESIYESLVARTPWEKDPTITEIEDITYNSIDDTSTSTGGGEWGGVCFTPTENIKLTSFTLREIQAIYQSAQSEDVQQTYLKIWSKNADDTWSLVANNTTYNSTRVTNTTDTTYKYDYTWNVQAFGGGDFIAKAGQEYHVTLNGNHSVDSYEIGYKIRFKVYPSNGKDLVLSNVKEIPHTDTSHTPNITLSGKKMSIEIPAGIEEEIPTEFYGEYIRNKHDISHKYDKTNNVVSFNDGIIKFSDGTIRYFDVQKAVIAKYLFRGDASSTITEFNTRETFDSWLNNSAPRNDFYYEYDVFKTKYDNDFDVTTQRPTMSTLQNVINGTNLFIRSRLTKFNDDLSCLMNGFQMFLSSSQLTTFRSALPSLTCGIKMFNGCSSLTKFETKLPNLVLAECMFRNDTALEEINTCLPNLTHAQGMFMYCSNLSKVRFSKNSFQCLYNGCDMFLDCSKLTSFPYELPYLETGDQMFTGCKLDLESVKIIAESLYDFGTKDSNGYAADGRKHVISFGVADGVAAQATQYKTDMENKGWVVEGI